MKEYKIQWNSITWMIARVIIGSLCIWGIYLIYFGELLPGATLSSNIMISFILCIGAFVCFAISVYDFNKGTVYHKIIYIPMEDLNVHLYDNMLILAYEGWAWTFVHNFKDIAKYKEIRALQKYNRKKKMTSWRLMPD